MNIESAVKEYWSDEKNYKETRLFDCLTRGKIRGRLWIGSKTGDFIMIPCLADKNLYTVRLNLLHKVPKKKQTVKF